MRPLKWMASGARLGIRHWPILLTGSFLIVILGLSAMATEVVLASFLRLLGGSIEWTSTTAALTGIIAWKVLVFLVCLPLLRIGIANVAVDALIGERPSFRSLFRPFARAVPTLAALGDRMIRTAASLLLLVFPGIAAFGRSTFGSLFAVRGLSCSPADAMRRSRALVWGALPQVLVLFGFTALAQWPLAELCGYTILLANVYAGIAVAILVLPPLLVWAQASKAAAFVDLCESGLGPRYLIDSAPERRQTTEQPQDERPTGRRVRRRGFALVFLLSAVLGGLGIAAADGFVRLRHPGLIEKTVNGRTPDAHRADGRVLVTDINDAQFFQNNELLAIATDHGIEIRSVDGFELKGVLAASRRVRKIAVSACGELAAATDGSLLTLWSLVTDELVWEIDLKASARALAFDPAGGKLAYGFGGESGQFVEVRSVESGELIRRLDLWEAYLKEPESGFIYRPDRNILDELYVINVEWNVDGRYVLAALQHRRFSRSSACFTAVWDAHDGGLIYHRVGFGVGAFTDEPTGIVADDYGECLDVVSGEYMYGCREPEIWRQHRDDPTRWRASRETGLMVAVRGSYAYVFPIGDDLAAMVPLCHGRLVREPARVTVGPIQVALPWMRMSTVGTSTATGASQMRFPMSWTWWEGSLLQCPEGFIISRDATLMFTWSAKRVMMWSLVTGEPAWDLPSPYPPHVEGMTVGENTGLLISRGFIHVMDLDAMALDGVVPLNAVALAISPDGQRCAMVGSNGGSLSIWRIGDWSKPLRHIWLPPILGYQRITKAQVRFADDGESVLVCRDGELFRWNPGSEPDVSHTTDDAVAWDLNGDMYGVVDSRGDVSVFNLRSGESWALLEVTGSNAGIAVDRTERKAAVFDEDRGIVLHDLHDRQMRPLLLNLASGRHDCDGRIDNLRREDAVLELRFLADGRWIVGRIQPADPAEIVSWDDSPPAEWMSVVVVWDAETARQLFVTPAGKYWGVESGVSLAGAPLLVVRTSDGILFWDLSESVADLEESL